MGHSSRRGPSVTKQTITSSNEASSHEFAEGVNGKSNRSLEAPTTYDVPTNDQGVDKNIVMNSEEELLEEIPADVNNNSGKKEKLDFMGTEEDDEDDGMSSKKVNGVLLVSITFPRNLIVANYIYLFIFLFFGSVSYQR